MKDMPETKPDYVVKPKFDSTKSPQVLCPCCGSQMKIEKISEKSNLVKCLECGLSDTRLL